ncbi:hypothetical protein FHS85_004791 [Rhodoligotrophos appendicifer]
MLDNVNVNNDDALDVLYGAASVNEYLGNPGVKRVYHWASSGFIPTFHIGALVCARKSALRKMLGEGA